MHSVFYGILAVLHIDLSFFGTSGKSLSEESDVHFRSLVQLPMKEIPQLIQNETTFGDPLLVHLMRPRSIPLGLSTQLVHSPQRESNISSSQSFPCGDKIKENMSYAAPAQHL